MKTHLLLLLTTLAGLQLAAQWHAPADCTLTAPAASLVRLAGAGTAGAGLWLLAS